MVEIESEELQPNNPEMQAIESKRLQTLLILPARLYAREQEAVEQLQQQYAV
jgi:hypothetical protein